MMPLLSSLYSATLTPFKLCCSVQISRFSLYYCAAFLLINTPFYFPFIWPNVPLLPPGCQEGHRAGGRHGETENEGGSEAGEQHVVSGRRRHHEEFHLKDCVLLVVWIINYIHQRTNVWQWLDCVTLSVKTIMTSWHNYCLKTKVFGRESEI